MQAKGAEGDDDDGDGGGEAATGHTITDEVASVTGGCVRGAGGVRHVLMTRRAFLRNLTPRYAPELLRMSAPKPCKL